MPDSSSERNPIEELAEEFLARYRRGDRPALSEYTIRYPELADEIRDLFPALLVMEDVRPGKDEPTGPYPGQHMESKQLERLGDYRILREVGRGGMGIVYEAEQESLGRHVALKLLPGHALLDPQRLRRFQREARAAARLHHSNIVPVFGVGEEAGVHYYVMQYIAGQGLDQVLAGLRRLRRRQDDGDPDSRVQRRLADTVLASDVARRLLSDSFTAGSPHSRPLSPEGRGAEEPLPSPGESVTLSETGRAYWQSVARIGIQVADALAYAHGHGILHRDIKPSNLLLDTQGTAWVTDFGLAKATDSDDLTGPGDIVGTVRYMAPERFGGQADERSDVYGLGITLYELLTLQPAFEASQRSKLMAQVLHGEPFRPRRINPAVPGDLETIVLKATAREPAHRYASAAELAADLTRFTEDRPIRARRVSTAERLWRWSCRNPAVAGLLLAVGVSLLLGTGIATYFAVRAQTALRAESRRREQSRAALDEMSSQVIEDWLARQNAEQLSPQHRAFLERTLVSYEEFAADTGQDEAARAGVAGAYFRVGSIRSRLGQGAEAEAAYARSRDLYQQLAIDFPAIPAYREGFARCQNTLGLLLAATGRVSDAEAAFRVALAARERLAADFPDVPAYRLDRAQCHDNLGKLLAGTDRVREAERAYRDALALCKALAIDFPAVSEHRRLLATIHNNLAILLVHGGRVDDARKTYEEALAVQKQLVAESPATPGYRQELARTYSNLGESLRSAGHAREAEQPLRDALPIKKQLAAEFPAVPQYRGELAQGHMNLGVLLATTGRSQEAEEAYRDALALYRQLATDFPVLADYQNGLANTMVNLAVLLANDRHDPASARQLIDESLPHHEVALRAYPHHPIYRMTFRTNRQLRAELLVNSGDHVAGAAAVAQFLEAAVDPANDGYHAARYLALCVRLVQSNTQLSEDERRKLTEEYAERAMAALRRAAAAGRKDLAALKQNQDLAPLRSRADFQELCTGPERQRR
jgi:serine/threonine protein kinase